ncbi:MAG TPA: SDR family NAD(P)-dependent oxidoreductase [Candidatus Margulisiibacteriota bacterium]|nr:SDR family NAD(P)-dependent oxidoreductase [Candidatus Margulisiibacteriota bacterium]
MRWSRKKVLVTGGASFIGSHLVDKLVERGATVRVADNLSSGKIKNIEGHIKKKRIEFLKGDLRDTSFAKNAVSGEEIIFHLAADHGGRGYVDLHQAGPASNLLMDGNLFYSALKAKAEKVIYASSGCVYPNYLQKDTKKRIFLKEGLVAPPYDADNMYGWAKLMAELTLKAYYREYGLKSCSLRYFTVYGERGVENHAVIAMIARAFVGENPFSVWGSGKQIRNWTYIDDIVSGTILAAEKIDDATAINLGTTERIRVIDAAREVLRYTRHKAKLVLCADMPTGPLNRVADNSLAKKLLGWRPRVKFYDGLHRTIDWYFSSKNKKEVRAYLSRMLTER